MPYAQVELEYITFVFLMLRANRVYYQQTNDFDRRARKTNARCARERVLNVNRQSARNVISVGCCGRLEISLLRAYPVVRGCAKSKCKQARYNPPSKHYNNRATLQSITALTRTTVITIIIEYYASTLSEFNVALNRNSTTFIAPTFSRGSLRARAYIKFKYSA